MDLSVYQQKASSTAVYPTIMELVVKALASQGDDKLAVGVKQALELTDLNSNPYYALLGLTGEAGELANKIKKVMRDSGGVISEKTSDSIKGELGDVMWYVAALATEMGFDLSEVAQSNLDKLSSRKEKGTLLGDGDNK